MTAKAPSFVRVSDLPKAIAIQGSAQELPQCYQGTPLEIVQEMANKVHKGTTVHDAIDWFLLYVEDTYKLRLVIPGPEVAEKDRAAVFVAALLATSVARPMPYPPS